MPEKVVFKLEVFEERIRRRAMKVVCDFPGVTLIDVKEKGKLKVTGEFDKFEMTKKLRKKVVKKPEPKVVKKPEPKLKKAPSYRGWNLGFFK
ncbi:hypothetical protein CARUB_v10028293mg [Capsella rubella]|uniref:HMA domain-containing protein n=1 Tax=Capsella rubella TaxID=81985 RepID=R0F060_9BRAS|nr:hypothetical protein CARUB_v10028293mg [Capsella rubella]